MTDFSKKSKDLTKTIPSNIKKNMGIYFTPPSIIAKHMDILKSHMDNIKTILEPSCGSGEYLNALDNGTHEITAIELDSTIYNSINDNNYKNVELINADFLRWETDKKFDLIIGNPPYFVIKKTEMPTEYGGFCDGRPNIFIGFVLRSLDLLNESGILGFVLPVSFTNCLYYDILRRHINEYYMILDITNCADDKYLDTNQETMLFTVKKQKNFSNKDFVYNRLDYTIFNTKVNNIALIELYKNSTTLSSLGFNVNIGNVIWNQKKGDLTNDESKTRLIYSSDIKENKLVLTKYKNPQKKNYIRQDGSQDLILVLNRGYGMGKYEFNYCLIDVNYDYLIENHLICIRSTGENTREQQKIIYNKIIASFENEKTQKFIKLYFGNNAINATELKYILPIY